MIPGWKPDWWHDHQKVKDTLSFTNSVSVKGNVMQLSAATLALINQAETDLATAEALDATAAASANAVTTAQAQATADAGNALSAHQTAGDSATAAINALKAELKVS